MATIRRTRRVQRHTELDVHGRAFEAAISLLRLSKEFPFEDRYSLSDQVRQSSRSVCANLAEAWRKCRYEVAFVSKLNDAESEAAQTQVWIQFAVKCGYASREFGRQIYNEYDAILPNS